VIDVLKNLPFLICGKFLWIESHVYLVLTDDFNLFKCLLDKSYIREATIKEVKYYRKILKLERI
jgi:hypothetical protein